MGRKWTEAEKEYLQEAWSRKTSVAYIAKRLGRSVAAIKVKQHRYNLGRKAEAGEWVPYNQVLNAVTGTTTGSGYALKSWIKNRGLPVRYITIVEKRVRVIKMKDFWRWAEDNKNFLDFSRFERFSLGPEPAWVEKKRQADIRSGKGRRTEPWTKDEDRILKSMTQCGKYTYEDIAHRLNRSEGAVAARLRNIGVKLWPLRHDPHESHWTREQYCQLRDLILQGVPYRLIGEAIGKTEKACRGRAYAIWRTENQDKIRERIPAYVGAFERALNGRGRKNAS